MRGLIQWIKAESGLFKSYTHSTTLKHLGNMELTIYRSMFPDFAALEGNLGVNMPFGWWWGTAHKTIQYIKGQYQVCP